jgi:nucleotidyltransferase substrate binding protein (TIGR01987 family)
MERPERLIEKLVELEKSLDDLEKSLAISMEGRSDIEVDTLRNGQIQKFELCVEMLWKTIRSFVLTKDNTLPMPGSKTTFQALYQLQIISASDFESLSDQIDRRNTLSHVYDKSEFMKIYNQLPQDLKFMKMILSKLKSNK